MAEPEDWPFIVRAWPVKTSGPPEDERQPTVEGAIAIAWRKAYDAHYRMVQVTDNYAMLWAQFGPLASARMIA